MDVIILLYRKETLRVDVVSYISDDLGMFSCISLVRWYTVQKQTIKVLSGILSTLLLPFCDFFLVLLKSQDS